MTFNQWIDTFVAEKGIDLDHTFEIEGGDWGTNFIPVAVVIEHMKITTPAEQKQIKNVIVKIDFANGDILDFFQYLAKAIAI